MSEWLFLRHGQSVANRDGWYAGSVDAALTPLGIEHAVATREALAAVPIAQAVCSDLSRARQTAELALHGRGVPLQQSPALRERCAGDWEYRSIAEVRDQHDTDAALVAWHGRPPGGESLAEVAVRAVRWLATLPDDKVTLVVSHGALMRAVIGALDGTPRNKVGHWHPPNCELVTRKLAPGTWLRILDALRADPGAK